MLKRHRELLNAVCRHRKRKRATSWSNCFLWRSTIARCRYRCIISGYPLVIKLILQVYLQKFANVQRKAMFPHGRHVSVKLLHAIYGIYRTVHISSLVAREGLPCELTKTKTKNSKRHLTTGVFCLRSSR